MSTRWTVEETKVLDIRKKHLSPSLNSIKPYFKEKLSGGSVLNWEGDMTHEFFQMEKFPIKLNIRITQVPCRFGGYRLWLICPKCWGRRMILHWIPGCTNYYCRKCLNLTYESCQRSTKNFMFSYLKTKWKYEDLLDNTKYLHKKRRARYEQKLRNIGCTEYFASLGPKKRNY